MKTTTPPAKGRKQPATPVAEEAADKRINVDLDPPERAVVIAAAAANERSLAGQVRFIVKEWAHNQTNHSA